MLHSTDNCTCKLALLKETQMTKVCSAHLGKYQRVTTALLSDWGVLAHGQLGLPGHLEAGHY